MEPIQRLNLNRRYILGLEPEMPVTHVGGYAVHNTIYLHICTCTSSSYFSHWIISAWTWI